MTRRPTLQDTLDRIERNLNAKTASEQASRGEGAPEAAPTVPGLLRKLANHLRQEVTQPVIVTEEDLYAVLKTAQAREPLPALHVDGSGPAHDLRKLAFGVRYAQRALEDRRLEKAAATIDAAEGLTLLREQLRSFS